MSLMDQYFLLFLILIKIFADNSSDIELIQFIYGSNSNYTIIPFDNYNNNTILYLY